MTTLMKELGRTILIFLISMFVIFFSLQSEAFAKGIAIIKSADIAPYNMAVKGFKSTIRKKVSEHTLQFDKEKGPYLNSGVDPAKASLIFALGTDALAYARKNLAQIPVIYTFVLYPEKVFKTTNNVDTSIVGINMSIPPDIQLRTLVNSAPHVKNVGVIYDPSKTSDLIKRAKRVAKELNINLITRKVKERADAINELTLIKNDIDALWMVPDTTAVTRESTEYMLLFSAESLIPLIGISDKYVKNGALFAFSFDINDVGSQAADIAKRILWGEKIKKYTSVNPRKFKLSMNLNIAKKIGLNIPKDLIKTADNIY